MLNDTAVLPSVKGNGIFEKNTILRKNTASVGCTVIFSHRRRLILSLFKIFLHIFLMCRPRFARKDSLTSPEYKCIIVS